MNLPPIPEDLSRLAGPGRTTKMRFGQTGLGFRVRLGAGCGAGFGPADGWFWRQIPNSSRTALRASSAASSTPVWSGSKPLSRTKFQATGASGLAGLRRPTMRTPRLPARGTWRWTRTLADVQDGGLGVPAGALDRLPADAADTLGGSGRQVDRCAGAGDPAAVGQAYGGEDVLLAAGGVAGGDGHCLGQFARPGGAPESHGVHHSSCVEVPLPRALLVGAGSSRSVLCRLSFGWPLVVRQSTQRERLWKRPAVGCGCGWWG